MIEKDLLPDQIGDADALGAAQIRLRLAFVGSLMPDEGDSTEDDTSDIDAEDTGERVEGVDFSNVSPLLEDIEYPITVDELVSEYGDRTLERTAADPISIRELLGEMGDDSFESPMEVRQTMLTMMPQDSEGSPGHSSRGAGGARYQEQEDETS